MLFAMLLLVLGSCEKEKEEDVLSDPMFGTWRIESSESLAIDGTDTLLSETNSDGRMFQLKADSVMLVYWNYPYSFKNSIWYRKGTDSLYLFFDGPESLIFFNYKYIPVDETRMKLEDTHGISEGIVLKTIYDVNKYE